ncbi:MAG TPA: VWA domain-containing protein [Trebonia sp.]|nr:VWA domain-containing protein [Trebonia sp.]
MAEAAGAAAGRSPGEVLTAVLLGFAGELRAAGLRAGTGEVLGYLAAMTPLDPTDLADLYWAGKATLVSRHDDDPVYDATFRRYFLDEDGPGRGQLSVSAAAAATAEAELVMPGTEPGPERDEEPPALGLLASDVDAVKHRSFGACTPQELAALRRIMSRMRLTPPRRRTWRTRPAATGTEPDPRATIRESLRMHGAPPGRLFYRQRKTRPRPLVLILDVSGSMAAYSRALLQFAHTARRAGGRVEVFCFGTRLTRITRELSGRRVDAALEAAAKTVLDWDGGTRIGQSLETFVRDYGRGGLARGGWW